MNLTQNSHRFFANKDCMYYPCHDMPNGAELNCLFCYCPLYSEGKYCGGIFTYADNDTLKLCMDCHLPHEASYYDEVIRRLIKT